MPFLNTFLAFLMGYLLGSIPFGYLTGKLKGVDVRTIGSGRTGGTNVSRALGLKWGIASGLLDAAKGLAAVLLIRWLLRDETAAALAGAAAVFGHNWPVWLRFKGGAGGGTAAGALIALNPLAAAIVVPIFVAVLLIGRYASLGTLSMALGSLVVLTALYFWGGEVASPAGHILYGALISIGIVWALRPNLARLRAGTESRIRFKKSGSV